MSTKRRVKPGVFNKSLRRIEAMSPPPTELQGHETACMTHEDAIVHSFIRPHRRERWLGLLRSSTGRKKLCAHLAHCEDDLDPRFVRQIPDDQQDVESLLRLLGRGDPTVDVHVLSANADLDGRVMKLDEALGRVVGFELATFLSIRLGSLAYFEGEEARSRFVCERIAVS